MVGANAEAVVKHYCVNKAPAPKRPKHVLQVPNKRAKVLETQATGEAPEAGTQ